MKLRNTAAVLTLALVAMSGTAHAWTAPECRTTTQPVVCATSVVLDHTERAGRTEFSFGMIGSQPVVILRRAEWSMPRRNLTLGLSVDRGPVFYRPVLTDTEGFIIEVTPDDFTLFAKAQRLLVYLPTETRWYSMEGSAFALRSLLEAWAAATAQAPRPPADPFTGVSNNDPFRPIAY